MSLRGFPGGGASDFYGGAGGFPSQSTGLQPSMNNHSATTHHPLYQSQPSILLNPSSHIAQHQTPTLLGKRTLAEFQTPNLNINNHSLNLINNINHNPLLSNHLLRSVKPRTFQHKGLSTTFPSHRYGLPLHYLRPNAVNPQQQQPLTNSIIANTNYLSPVHSRLTATHEPEKNLLYLRLQELEKQLLEDDDDDAVSAITTTSISEWSQTLQNLITPQKPASSSPISSTTSSNTSVESISSKQSLMEAATAISEGKFDAATEILTRLSLNSDQRFVHCMVSALKSRMNQVEYPPPVAELFGTEHAESTQLLFEHSLFFKIARMVANIAILESALTESGKLCVVDFAFCDENQYVTLLHMLSARRKGIPSAVKIIAVEENGADDERLNTVGVLLGRHAEKLGIGFEFKVLTRRIAELTRDSLGCDADEALAVNFAYKLYKMPDESVSTENPRDELLRQVKALAPRVVTLVEQEANVNTAPFVARVSELCAYYGALFDSLESTMARENSKRVRIEEGLSRKVRNSVACEGRDRVERCEVFGKWRARMRIAGYRLKPLSQRVAESIKARLVGAGNRVSVKVENGGICFGWMGRTLTVASAWC